MYYTVCDEQGTLAEYPDRIIPIYTELHELIEAVHGELKTYNDNGGGAGGDDDAFDESDGTWNVRPVDRIGHIWKYVEPALEIDVLAQPPFRASGLYTYKKIRWAGVRNRRACTAPL